MRHNLEVEKSVGQRLQVDHVKLLNFVSLFQHTFFHLFFQNCVVLPLEVAGTP